MQVSSLFNWLRRKLTAPRAPIAVHMYTRTGCHLCEEAWNQIARLEKQYHVVLAQTDVDTDPELAARFGDCVPVVTVNGKERCRGRVSSVLLERALRAETRGSAGH
jgi:glutaredoxin